MFLFEELIERLKEELKLKSDKELYDIMEVSQGTFSNWRKRNKIPYEEIITLCFNKNIDIKQIITGQKHINKCPELDYKSEIHKMIDELDNKKSEIYYHLIKAEILKEKL
jgi:hypothetical protein